MPLLSDTDLGLTPRQSAVPKRLLSDDELLRAPLYLGAQGEALSPDAVTALYNKPQAPEPSWPEKIGLAIQQADTDPVGSLAGSAATILSKLGIMSESGADRLGRDIYAGISSLGPLGAEFAGGAGVRGVPRALAVAPAGASPRAGLLQAKLDALAPKPARLLSDEEVLGAPQPNRAGNINLNRIQAPDDVKNVIRETAAQNQNFEGARRGVVTFDDIRELAPLVGMTPEKLATRKLGQTYNAEEMFAARNLLVTQATEVKRLATAARGGSDADKVAALQAITRMVATQEQVAGATAEAGRLLSQFRMMAGATKDADSITRLLAATGGRIDDIIEGVAKLDDPAQIANFIKKGMAARTSDMLLEAWINALLSGPTTHATNILSNSLVSLWSIPETAVASGISKVTGSGIRGSEVLGRAFGLIEGAKDGIRAGWRTFRSEEPSDLTSKIESAKYRAIPSVTVGSAEIGGKQVRIPGRMLMAEDEFFKAIGYRQEINAQSYRIAANEGLKGEALAQRIAALRANPTDAMAKAARDAAEKQTFTNPLGKFGQSLQAMTREVPALRIVMPFIRTPVNIVKFAAERSPFAPLFKGVRENLSGKNGAAARDTQIARIALGSSVSAVAAYLALEGGITGGGPADPKRRAVQYETGWQPYSVKIGDSYYSFGRLEPLGMMLGVAADFTELSSAMSDDETKNVAALIMGSVQKNLVSKTWLRGLSEMIEAFQDPERYGSQYVQNFSGTLVPTGVAQVARNRDPYLREARTILDKIKERVPGLRETLPPRRGLFGDAIKLEGSLGPDLLSPVYMSKANDDPVVREIARLRMGPSKPPRKIRGTELGPQEYDSYQQSVGFMARSMLSQVIAAPGYARLPDDEKRELIDDVFSKARDAARGRTLQQFPDLIERIKVRK